jgi:hypothetical protein
MLHCHFRQLVVEDAYEYSIAEKATKYAAFFLSQTV